jgi:hypothetical protein
MLARTRTTFEHRIFPAWQSQGPNFILNLDPGPSPWPPLAEVATSPKDWLLA